MKVLTVYAHPNPKSFCHAVLQQFTKGLADAGHSSEVVDLYAIRFNPVFQMADFASYVHESIPKEVLERMNLKKYILDSMRGPFQRFFVARWLRGKDDPSIAKFIHAHRPKDVVAQWEKVNQAEGLAFIAPVFWLGFPAILKGWFDRVLVPGVSFSIDANGAVHAALTNIRKIAGISTYGRPWWHVRLIVGDLPRRHITHYFKALCGWGARAKYLALYDTNRTTAARRDRFLAQVRRLVKQL